MKVTVIVICAVFVCLIYCDVGLANYSLECPEISHWKIRADSECNGNTDKYHCLYDPNKDRIKELCANPEDFPAGFMAVHRGNIDADLCPGYRYMPWNFKSNKRESCIFLKSKCNGEGQLVHYNWSLVEDTACMCDFSNGYAFIQNPKNNCFCVPSLEDCSCYKKPCNNNNDVISPDYDCIAHKQEKTQPLDSYNFQCHPYQDRIKAETNDKMILVSPCLSDYCSTFIKKDQFKDRSICVKLIIVIIMIMILLLGLMIMIELIGLKYLNEDEGRKQIDTLDFTCQTLEEHQENRTKPKKPVDNNINADDYFIINCNHNILQIYDGMKLQKGFDKQPRILDMCFVKLNNGIHLVYIDADNEILVVRSIISNTSKPKTEKLDHVPNRLAKIDNSTVGVIYKKELHILIFDVDKMERKMSYSISQSDIMKSQNHVPGNLSNAQVNITISEIRIQGIVALSPTEFILSDKIRLHRCILDEFNEKADVSEFASSLDPFDTARRLTHVTVSQGNCQEVIFIADENDKKLTSISQKENFLSNHTKPNRGLQNVRAIGATEHRVYAATSAGISVFCHNKGVFKKFENQDNEIADYKMILEYEKHVEHTRGLCLHLDEKYIYIGLSCVIKQKDVILIFKFKPDNIFK